MSSITYFHPHITALIYASLCYTFIYLFILASVLAWRQHNNMLGSALPVLSKHRMSGLFHCSPKACLNRGLIQSFLSRPALGGVGSLSILYNAVFCRIYIRQLADFQNLDLWATLRDSQIWPVYVFLGELLSLLLLCFLSLVWDGEEILLFSSTSEKMSKHLLLQMPSLLPSGLW